MMEYVKMIFFAKIIILMILLVGCDNDYDPEITDELIQEEAGYVNQEVAPYGSLLEEEAVFIVSEIFEENGNVLAQLIPSEPRLRFFESPRFIGIEEGVETERIFFADFDSSTLWLGRRGLVEIEEENSSTISDATTLDIVEGDVLRLHIRDIIVPASEWGGVGNVVSLERITIVR